MNQTQRRPSQREARRALDVAATRLDRATIKVNASQEDGMLAKNTPEYLELRKRRVDYRNALNVYRAAGGDKQYAGTITIEKEEEIK